MSPSVLEPLRECTNQRTFELFARAHSFSEERLSTCHELIDDFLKRRSVDPSGLCFIAVGSVGRYEALAASDLDILPIVQNPSDWPDPLDKELRGVLGERLEVKISQGSELTRSTSLEELTDPATIGGSHDSSAALTRRILALSEGAQAGGEFEIANVRREVLDAYGAKERTSGRHVLSLCNDLARYYRQLCIDYKNKVDVEDKDWSSRNIKLRHSRKFWYFANLVAIAARSTLEVQEETSYRDGLIEIFGQPPTVRLVQSLPKPLRVAASPILKSFSWFLTFMEKPENREALQRIEHSTRYAPELENPFPALKHNSDVLHQHMIRLLDALDTPTHHRVLDWFLL